MSPLEYKMEIILRSMKVDYKTQYVFHPSRKWKIDFVILPNIAIECQGGLYTGGAHVRGARYEEDLEKQNELNIMGWKVLQYGTTTINNERRIVIDIEEALRIKDVKTIFCKKCKCKHYVNIDCNKLDLAIASKKNKSKFKEIRK